jgi:hypothetical protein
MCILSFHNRLKVTTFELIKIILRSGAIQQSEKEQKAFVISSSRCSSPRPLPPQLYVLAMSHVEKPATGGREGTEYFYDTFGFEICFFGIYFYGIYIYGIYLLIS